MSSSVNVEGHRIIAVLNDALSRMEIASLLHEGLSEKSICVKSLPPNIEIAIRNHLRTEEKLLKFANDDHEEMSMLELSESFKALCRVVQSDIDSKQILRENDRDYNSQGIKKLLFHFNELRDLVEYRLGTTIEQDEMRREMIQDKSTRIQEAQQDIKRVKVELRKERELKEIDFETNTKITNKLKASLSHTKRQTDQNCTLVEQDAKQLVYSQATKYEGQKSKFDEKQMELLTTLEKSKGDYFVVEELQRKKNMRAKIELESFIEKYDFEMQSLVDQIEEIEVEIENENAEINRLSEFFAKIEDDRRYELMELKMIEKHAEEQKQEQVRIEKSVVKLQANVRGFLVRKHYRDALTKKKSKKSSKKKKKGRK